MPLDSTTGDLTALYIKRREAAAEIWRAVPDEYFEISSDRCGSTACALGWLAIKKHDGWHWDTDNELPDWISEISDDRDPEAAYFGITGSDAADLFGYGNYDVFYGHINRRILGSDVADALLALPVTLPAVAQVRGP
jgi:hypothetical protein